MIPPKAASAQKKLLEMNVKSDDPSILLVGVWVHIYLLDDDVVCSGL